MIRVAFVHGRPGTHPNRVRLLKEINADFVPVDFRLPWAHLADPPRTLMVLSLIACALTFPNRRRYHLFLGDGPQFLPVVMKSLGVLGRGQRAIPYLANETPYFLATEWYGPWKTKLLKAIFNRWDGYLCVGEMMEELTRRLVHQTKQASVFRIVNFIRNERSAVMGAVRPTLDGRNILFVGNGPGGFRVWYKGLDLMLDAFKRALRKDPRLRLTVVGHWDASVVQRLVQRSGFEGSDRVRFVGPTTEIARLIEESSLYLHCSRGDAWPNSVMEAMCAGLPPLISEWTGAREAVRQVSPGLIAPLDPTTVASRIEWYFDLSRSERLDLSDGCRQVISQYSEDRSVSEFVLTFRRLIEHFDLPALPFEVTGRRERADA